MKKTIFFGLLILISIVLIACGGRKVTITFQSNGGSQVQAMTVNQLKPFEEPETTRQGYTFRGWFREETFENEFDFNEGSSRNLTLYASWEINSYTLTLNFNNGEAQQSISGDYNTVINLPTPTRDGYTFGGWYRDQNLNNVFEATRMPASNLNLYARWTAIVFVITFSVDGEVLATRTVEHGQTLTNIPNIPAREGYDAVWSTTNFTNITDDLEVEAVYTKKVYEVAYKDSEGIVYETLSVEHGDKVSELDPIPAKDGYTFANYSWDFDDAIIEDTEIVVFFMPITYTVTFNGFNGVFIETETVIMGQSANAPSDPEAEGHTFVGWDKDFDNITSNLVVNANFTRNIYLLTLNANGGVFADETEVRTIEYEYTSNIPNPTAPTRLGYNFVDWKDEDGNTITFPRSMNSTDGITVFASWSVINYTITYHNLSGADTGNSLQYNIETATFNLSNPTSRTGYAFVGWFDAETEGNQITQIIVGSTGNKDIYARWTVVEYDITYENLQGTAANNPATYTILDPITLADPEARDHYEFAGWFTALVGGTEVTEIAVGTTGDLDLYARWTPISYDINYYDLEGSTNSNPETYHIETATFSLSPLADREHYLFVGWYDEEIGGTEVTEIAVGTTGDLDLYARWEAREYTITFNIDGNMSTIEVPYLTILTADDVPEIPTKAHYDQVDPEWDNDPINYEVVGNQTFTVIYYINEYTITFDSNEGSEVEAITGEYLIVIPTFETPTREGYTFGGWYKDNNTFTEQYTNNTYIESITLYAKWTEYPSITFISNGGSNVSPISEAPETPISEPVAPTRNGYDFAGWYLDNNTFENEYVFEEMPEEDLQLYARWTVVEYDITYENLQGAAANNPATYTILDPITLADPETRDYYEFAGWFTALVGGTEVTSISGTGARTVYARWTPISYDINYNNLEGSANTNPTTYHIETTTFSLSALADREHYLFVGWYDEEIGGTEVTEIALGTTGDLDLYARWKAREYTITFNIDGNMSTIEVPYLTILTADDVPEIPTKAHYDQVDPEWDNDPINYEVVGNQTFTVIYYINEYTITFDTNNGEPMDPISVTYNTTATSIANPVRLGYSFIAWYTDIELIDLFDINDPIIGNMTLYATYEIQYYDVHIDSIFEKQDLEDEEIVTYEYTEQFTIFNVLYGELISPIRNYEGYVFHHFIYEGDIYVSIDDLIEVLGNITGSDVIEVYYRRIIITITFNQDPNLFLDPEEEANPNESFRVYYNESFNIANAPVLREKAGNSVYWNRTQFENLRQNVDVYALYYETGVKTISFNDRGTIRYLATQQQDIHEEWIDEALDISSPIWNLSRTGYKFLGWYTEAVGGAQIVPGTLLFSSFTEMQTVLYARWQELTPFNKPTNINVIVDLDNEEITISWTLNPATINSEQPKEFSFILNNAEIIVPIADVLLSGTTYTLDLTSGSDLFNDFKDLLEVGKHELTIQAIGDGTNHYHGPTSDVKIHSNDSIYDEDPTDVAIYDYFIVEEFGDVRRYVFYSNLTYVFGSSYSFEIITGHEFASVEDNKIITKNNFGTFRFRMIRTDQPTVVYDALVIPDVRGFSIGSNYQTYLNAQLGSSTRFLNSGEPYYVGYRNNYYLDIRILNNQGSRIPLSQVELTYELYQVISGTPQLIQQSAWNDHIEFFDGNQFRMKESALGSTYEIRVTPRYQATQMQVSELTYRFTVNEGHNAFTNQQLRSLYANMDVEKINIHANIEATLAANQMNADGSPINKRPYDDPNSGDVYTRFARNVDNDEITIEGNYMTIDGSNLPYSNKDSGSGLVGLAEAFEIINVRIAIFGYDVKNNASGLMNNNEFNIKNLQILGNTTIPSVNFGGTAEEILQQEQLMSRNSGGYIGIMVQNGAANYTNLDIRFTVIGIMHDSFGYKNIEETTPIALGQINYVKINDNWANSIYTSGSVGIEIINSYIGQSGGPAIHVKDTRQGGAEKNPTIIIHNSTEVKNYISGEEAWFKAYGMSTIALQLKSGIENGISGTQRSIIDLITNPVTGLESEMINVILLTETSDGAKTVDVDDNNMQNGGSEVKFVLHDDTGVTTLERAWNYLNSGDLRIANEQFGFPVGDYSNVSAFQTLIGTIQAIASGMEIPPLTEAEAVNLALLASFYNLDAMEVLSVYGFVLQHGGTYINAINTIYPEHTFPRYMEVLAPVPILQGVSTVLIELVDLN